MKSRNRLPPSCDDGIAVHNPHFSNVFSPSMPPFCRMGATLQNSKLKLALSLECLKSSNRTQSSDLKRRMRVIFTKKAHFTFGVGLELVHEYDCCFDNITFPLNSMFASNITHNKAGISWLLL